MDGQILAAALRYAANGFKVVPLTGKRPWLKKWPDKASNDPAVIRGWWRERPDSNVGIAPSPDFCVLDIDSSKGGDETIARLEHQHGQLPITVASRTGGGGTHHYYRVKPGRSLQYKLGKGIELLGVGRQAVEWPSVHPDTRKVYEWVEGQSALEAQMADAPEWFYSTERRSNGSSSGHVHRTDERAYRYCRRALDGEREALARTPAGGRNDALNRAAVSLASLAHYGAYTEAEALAALRAACEANGLFAEDGIKAFEATFASGWQHGLANPRQTDLNTTTFVSPGVTQGNVDQPNGQTENADDEDWDAAVARLARLRPHEYDRVREGERKRLGIRIGTLDAAVAKARGESSSEVTGQGRSLDLPTPEPWPHCIEGAELLGEMTKAVRRYIALPNHADAAIALWAVHTHAAEVSPITPRLAITSPEKRCGKSTLLRVLAKLVAKPLLADNISAASMFRTIELARPTLLIDEADTFLANSEELRGIMNSGHHRDGQVIRTVGDDHEPRMFSTWAPVAIACIGKLSGTIEDRSVAVPMRRRRTDEPVERFRLDRCDDLAILAQKSARWATDNLAVLGECDPKVPDELHDRAADNWRPLLAIADVAGGDWPVRARRAAIALCSGDAAEDGSVRVTLLADVKAAFDDVRTDRIGSADLVARLAAREDRPWPEWKNGRPLTVRQLAKLLGPLGIVPTTIRIGDTTPKGYMRAAFDDAFARYLPCDPQQHHKLDERSTCRDSSLAANTPVLRIERVEKPRESERCGGVADESEDSREEEKAWIA